MFAKTRKYVDDHRTYLAFCAGSVTTSAVFWYLTKDKTLLSVSTAHQEMLKAGGGIVFNLKDQTVHLVNIPAVEAAQASL